MGNRVLKMILLFIAMSTCNVFAASNEDMEQATILMKNFRLDVKNCPTLEEVADKHLTNVKWDNPGGSDDFYCYAKLIGMQSNNEVFSAIFRYDIEAQKAEPFSLRIGKKLYIKSEAIQKYLVKFYASECEELRQFVQQHN